MSDRQRTDPTNRPFHPSRDLKLQEEFSVTALNIPGPFPQGIGLGFDVDKWASVLITVHPSNPNFQFGPVAGWAITFRPWKYREAASRGSRQPSGQWFALDDWTVPLDGVGEMEKAFFVGTAKKLYLQPLSWVNAPGGSPEISLGGYGIGRYGDPNSPMLGVVAAGSGTLAIPIPLPVSITAPLPLPVLVGAETYAAQPAAAPLNTQQQLVSLPTRELVIAGFNWIAQANRTEEINPIYLRQDPVPEIEESGGITAPVGSPAEVFIDMNTFQHQAFQVVTNYLTPGGAPADLVSVDLAYTARPTGTPGALPATDWTPVNTEVFGTAAGAPLTNAAGDISQLFTANFFRGQWLRLRAWASNPGAIQGNVALWVLRQSWY
jgi:hypothetical protein